MSVQKALHEIAGYDAGPSVRCTLLVDGELLFFLPEVVRVVG